MKKKNRTQSAAIVRNDPKRLHTGGTMAFPWLARLAVLAAVFVVGCGKSPSPRVDRPDCVVNWDTCATVILTCPGGTPRSEVTSRGLLAWCELDGGPR